MVFEYRLSILFARHENAQRKLSGERLLDRYGFSAELPKQEENWPQKGAKNAKGKSNEK